MNRLRFPTFRAQCGGSTLYSVSLSRPRWAVGPLAWAARVVGLDRRWTARGETPGELDTDLRRLGALHGITVRQIEHGSWEMHGSVVTIFDRCEQPRAAEHEIAQRAPGIVGAENDHPVLGEGLTRS